jgi:formylglycine-generating enzyme
MTTKKSFGLALALFCITLADVAIADTFGSGANTFEMAFVTIGNPGNVADTTGSPNPAGSVPYTYRIGKFEISEDMIDKANALGGLGITKDSRAPDKPATSVSWFEAARFVNWLNTSSGGVPAYKFNGNSFELWAPGDAGYDPNNLFRNGLARYFLPSFDEWYKAAYSDPTSGGYFNYPTGSDTAPTAVMSGTAPGTAVISQSFATGPAAVTLAGGLSPYGTMGQGGNVDEWEESEFDLTNNSPSAIRGFRGGNWDRSPAFLLSSNRFSVAPSIEDNILGFRVASIPEPSTIVLLATTILLLRRRTERVVH